MGADERRHRATRAALIGVLRALGAPVERDADLAEALAGRRRAVAERMVEPVLVAWEGTLGPQELTLPPTARGRARVRVELEEGGRREGEALARPLPLGYHRLVVEAGRRRAEALVVSAPRRAPGSDRDRSWGVFLPLHALRTRRDRGVADLSDLQALARWVGSLGGQAVATLPLAATFDGGELHDPSPYSPASRLFWNELHLDLERLPAWAAAGATSALPGLARERSALRRLDLVDHQRAMALVRRLLDAAVDGLGDRGRAAIDAGLSRDPLLRAYARFRAVCERRREWWGRWPARLRDGDLRPTDADRAVELRHVLAQLSMQEQVSDLAARSARSGVRLFLDLPLAVNPAGFDVWRFRPLFAMAATGGAPPDPFQARGQDWGFPPPHPERIREDGHAYLRAVLGRLFRHAGLVRVDHVMGLHRLYWIPEGLEAGDGAYVRYPAQELYAVMLVEAHRHGVVVAGEDLGTVPPSVRASMRRHGVLRSFVGQFAVKPRRRIVFHPPRAGTVASMNTHDLPTFASYWEGRDIEERLARGELRVREADATRRARSRARQALLATLEREGWVAEPSAGAGLETEAVGRAVLVACLRALAASEARVVVVNLEDLWWERRPQNVPGTGPELPNWRRRAARTLEEVRRMPEVDEVLREVDRLRRGASR